MFVVKTVLVIPVLPVLAQQLPSPTPQNISESDEKLRRRYEDDIARLFEKVRTNAKLEHLSRINHREDLEQLVCTYALSNTDVSLQNGLDETFYKTYQPGVITPELDRIAHYDRHIKDSPDAKRYAIALWPGVTEGPGKRLYWVGVGVYVSGLWEFFILNLTDSRYNKDDWKKEVIPACEGLR